MQLKWNHQFQFAGYYAAIEQGYYREAGLDTRLIEISPGVTPIDQSVGGRVDFSVTGYQRLDLSANRRAAAGPGGNFPVFPLPF